MESNNSVLQSHTPETKPEVYESMPQVAAIKQIPLATLRAAKNAGCPGFRTGGRIDWSLAGVWIEANRPNLVIEERQSFSELRNEKLEVEIETKKYDLAQKQGQFLSKDEVALQVKALAAAAKAVLKSQLETELPSKLVGLDEIAIKELLTRTTDSVCGVFEKGFESWN